MVPTSRFQRLGRPGAGCGRLELSVAAAAAVGRGLLASEGTLRWIDQARGTARAAMIMLKTLFSCNQLLDIVCTKVLVYATLFIFV